jgi:hypothetical protein
MPRSINFDIENVEERKKLLPAEDVFDDGFGNGFIGSSAMSWAICAFIILLILVPILS